MKLLNKNILVEPIIDSKTESGIEIPHNDESVPKGKVLAVAEDIVDVSVGDIIAHNIAYDELEDKNRIVEMRDVLAIYEEGDC